MERKGLRSHLTGTVPISIAIHLVALMMLIVIPLVANVVIPTVSVSLPDYVRVVMPPPPAVAMRPPAGTSPAPLDTSSLAPTHAPDTIGPERSVAPPGLEIPGAVGISPGDAGATTVGPTVPPPPPPPDPPKQLGPVRLADLPVAPRKTVDARPVYPDIARLARIEGTVVMEAVLDPSGHVTQIRVIRSIPLLDQAAIDAVRQWRYTPSVYNGRPVSVLMTITIRFTLQ
jgi:periplasmic protein TonB